MAAKKRKPAPKKAAPTQMTSIRLDPALIETLKARAASLGIGWQTLIKMILKRYGERPF